MKTRYILIAIAALAMSACAKTNEQPEPEGSQVIIRAYQEGAHGTKTTVQDGGTQVYWEPNDEIKVFYRGNGGRFISNNNQNDAIAEFSGTLNILVGLNEGAAGSNDLWGLYPYRSDATSDGSSVTTTLPAEQTGRAGSFAKHTHISLARSNSHDLAFYNVTGGVRFSLTQDGIKSVTFEGNNGESLAGKINLAFEGGVPVVQSVSEGESTLTLTAPNGGTFETGKWYYIEAIPVTLSSGFKMVFSKGTETAKVSSSNSVTIYRGRYGSIADADEGLIFKENGDDPDPSSVIQFADPIAKYACVEKYDTDGDGEVSYAEAAAVTYFDGLFNDWNTVTSFEEIKYFTGVTSTSGLFNGLKKLERITIPEFITNVGTFQNCSSLTTVVLPSGVQLLPSYCFASCSALTSVTLPSSLTSIPYRCFQNCTALQTLDIPSSVTTIDQDAFNGCSALTGLDLPSGLKKIGAGTFSYCTSIVLIDLPSSLTSIGSNAFYGCTSLTSISIGDGVYVGGSVFAECSALTTVVLPSDMTEIPSSLFFNCSALKSITWPSALESVGDLAFKGCVISRDNSDDSKIELPATVKSIGAGAFWGIRHIILPSSSAISIASDTFVKDYTRIYVPAGMIEMYKVRTNWSDYKDQIFPISDYPVNDCPVADAVDLGLSVKWASWNVGASSPEEYGEYFAWGETAPNWNYDWSTYKWCNGDSNKLTKYCTRSSYWDSSAPMDNKTVLDPEDDAASVNWGGNWRMPTDAEWTELIQKCTWTWTSQNGVSGYLVTGPNSNSIFLPAAGFRGGTDLYYAGSRCYYWSSSLSTDYPYDAWCVYFDSGGVDRDYNFRCGGLSVRPVSE